MGTIIEVVGSREEVVSKEDPSIPLKYLVFGDDTYDPLVVKLLVQGVIPAFIGQMVFRDYRMHDQGAGNWLIEAYYGRKYPRKPGDKYMHFDLTTEKVRTFTSYSSNYFPALTNPTLSGANGSDFFPTIPFYGAVNVKDSGSKRRVEGVEVEDPAFAFAITRIFGPDFPVTQTFVDNLKALLGKVNSDTITFGINVYTGGSTSDTIVMTFQAGELLFHGASGSFDEDTHQEVVMRFSSYQNIQFGTGGIPNCAGVPNVYKPGFDYLWVAYAEEQASLTGGSGWMVPKPRQVCVEQVYLHAPLTPLFT
jgi:hypothetical protein